VIPVAAFLLGLLIGSFLNVCIHRLPKDESIVTPRSHCPHCGQPISWYDNIPVASFILLRGRCRDCGGAISFRYPLVELLTAVSFALVAGQYGLTLAALKYAAFVAMMLVLAFADLADRILPDEITIGGAAAGVLLSLFQPLPPPAMASFLLGLWRVTLSARFASLAESVVGALVAAGLVWVVAEIYFRVRHREGMGLGDIKMMALIGAFVGLRDALVIVMAASVLGAVLGLFFILLFRKGMTYELPFGTFLAFAAILMVVLAHETA
jgi:leader peptidase (prepilin peptidase)/N-methyltransferase